MSKLEKGTIMNLDSTGLFYSSVATPEHPGTFSVGTYLNEDINLDALTKAVERLYKRLPHFNVAIIHEDNQNKNIALDSPVLPEEDDLDFCKYFEEGKATSRVVYGKNYFTIEVLHSVCDGGTLTKAIKALTIEYFNQLGVKTPFQEINLDDEFSMDEIENSIAKYAKPLNGNLPFGDTKPYRMEGKEIKSKKYSFNLNCHEVKAKAKALGATVTEYMIANMIEEIDKERKLKKDTNPIVINIPLDCRKYFPSKTLRNFVIAFNVVADTWDSFDDLLARVHNQMSSIDQEYVQTYVNASALVSLAISKNSYEETKENFFKFEGKAGGDSMSTVISNVGLVKYDPLIQSRIHHMDFTLCPCVSCPYQFSTVTCGDVLNVTCTVAIEEVDTLNKIIERF